MTPSSYFYDSWKGPHISARFSFMISNIIFWKFSYLSILEKAFENLSINRATHNLVFISVYRFRNNYLKFNVSFLWFFPGKTNFSHGHSRLLKWSQKRIKWSNIRIKDVCIEVTLILVTQERWPRASNFLQGEKRQSFWAWDGALFQTHIVK